MPLEQGVTLLLSRVTGAQFDDMGIAIKRQRKDVKVLLISSRGVSTARRLLAGIARHKGPHAGFSPVCMDRGHGLQAPGSPSHAVDSRR